MRTSDGGNTRGSKKLVQQKKVTRFRGGGNNSPAWLGSTGSNTTANQQQVFGNKPQKRIRGAPVRDQLEATGTANIYVESPSAPSPATPLAPTGNNVKRQRGEGGNVRIENQRDMQTLGDLRRQQDIVRNQQRIINDIPDWLNAGLYAPGGLSPTQYANMATELQSQAEKPYRIQNPDGSYSYLQSDGTYLASTGTAGGIDGTGTLHNSYTWMPPLPQLPSAPSNPFASGYSGWGYSPASGYSGGGGYTPAVKQPAWYMNLRNWNFGE